MNRPRPVELSWHLPVRCTVQHAWDGVSDTDRFNRALGMAIRFTETVRPDGSVERRGELKRFGMTLSWEEYPFEYCAPSRFTHARDFDNGPVSRAEVECHVEPAGDGSIIHYTLRFTPRRLLLRPVVMADARLNTRAGVERTLQQLVAMLEGRPNTYDPAAPKLDSAAQEALAELARIEPPELGAAIRTHIQEAPLAQQARLRPLAFAEQLSLDEDTVIRGFLGAVRTGVLELSWELLCPSCLAPKQGRAQLDLRPGQVHCPSCDIRYDGSFPDSVDVVFRPAKHIRDVQVEVACLLSPGRTPHVQVHETVQPGARVEWLLSLRPGGHRLETDPDLGTASVEVRNGIRSNRITVDLTEQGIRPAVLRVGPGEVRVVVRNCTGRPLRAQLASSWRPRHTLTAGRLFELPESRDLLPPEAVAPDLNVSVRASWVVALRQVTVAETADATGEWDQPTGVFSNGTLIRVFADLDAVLDFIEPHDATPFTAVGVAWGPVVTLVQEDDCMPSGSTVDRALETMRAVGGGHIGVHPTGTGAIAEAIGGRAVLRTPSEDSCALLRFASAADRHADAVRDQQLHPPPMPSSIAGYEVHEELGRGAMGRVLAAVAPDGSPVVLKLLLPELSADPDKAQRFYNEACLTAELDHPNIVRVLDYGTSEAGEIYMAMERLQGHELEAFVDAGVLSADRVQHLAVQILDGLQAAHEAGVVHRDIKPANIFVLEDGQVKVIDFGIAHPIEQEDELAERGVVLGSPRYMSPEQVARDPLDARSDLYSVALLMYECLTGDIPFTGDTVFALALARIEDDPIPLSGRCDALPVGFEHLVMRALQVDPPRRWASATEMADALAAIECS